MNTDENTDPGLAHEELSIDPSVLEPVADPETVGEREQLSGEEILRRMSTIRAQIDEHVDEVTAQVKDLKDWRSHVRRHPWLSVSAAAAVGFVVVPSRKQSGKGNSPRTARQRTSVAAAEELRSVFVAAAKKAATAYASKSLGALMNGFVDFRERT